jgi:MYXO-CTERM domain-containing protein
VLFRSGLDGALNAEVHSTGEVWCTMLWEAYVALLKSSPRLTFDEARDRMMRYLVAAYKITPLMPTFVEARDALLAAAVARDQQDFAVMWAAFARRGLGMLAVAPDRDAADNKPAVESFVVGNALAITALTVDDSTTSCDMDGVLDTDEAGVAKVTVKNVGVGELTGATVTLSSSLMAVAFPQGATTTVPTIAPFASATVSVPVSLRGVRGMQGVVFTVAANAATLAVAGPVTKDFTVRLNTNVVPNGTATDDVEAPMSRWTAASDPRYTQGNGWRVNVASPTSHWWFGPNPAAPADNYLVSPQLSVGTAPFTLTFRHRFDFEADANTFYDGAVVELSTDGRTWTDIGSNGQPGYTGQFPAQTTNPLRGRRGYAGKSTNYPAFIAERIDLGTMYAGQMVRVRFRIGSDDASAQKGWEVDDIAFTGLAELPFTSVATDPNRCSSNRAPTLAPVSNLTVREGDLVTLTGSGSDPDGDPVTITFVQREGPFVDLNMGSFVAPSVDATTELAFDVAASDGALESMPQRLVVRVIDTASAPTVTAPPMLEVNEGQAGSVTATGMDPQGDAISFTWRQVSGPPMELLDATSDTVRFHGPYVSADSVVVLEVVANDGQVDSVPARVELTVRDVPLTAGEVAQGPLPKGCGCSSSNDALWALALIVIASRRRGGRRPT